MSTMDDALVNEVVKCLFKIGLCDNCILRFLQDPTKELRTTPPVITYKYKERLRLLSTERGPAWTRVPCMGCLNILKDETLAAIETELCTLRVDTSKVYSFGVTVPKSLMIRDCCLLRYLNDRYQIISPELFTHSVLEILKCFLYNTAAKSSIELHYTSENRIFVTFEYDDDLLEVVRFTQAEKGVDSLGKDINKLPKRVLAEMSKRPISSEKLRVIVNQIQDYNLKVFYGVPPSIPRSKAYSKPIRCIAHCYFGGWYTKHSRTLPHLRACANEGETSIEDAIVGEMQNMLQVPKDAIRFSPLGWEKTEVRMLGKGRPFTIFVNVPTMPFSQELLDQVQHEINRKTDGLTVSGLKTVRKLDNDLLRESQQLLKSYTVLCKLYRTNSDSTKVINSINSVSKIMVEQKTPIRKLMQKALATKNRYIESMEAKCLPDQKQLFIVDITTESGLKLDEFIHGDLGRTHPSLASLTGEIVEMVALDVCKIHLEDWPSPNLEKTFKLYS